ncbi:breast cancer type 2 susceptibility protein isoform X2 [Dendrobates tinctorius]|uniref:breast cancer type 2 susceptibility protein isoform X2 n=1 Tax=Dendrobates tinctorius TaxID=92724 RepID=UPI003CC9BACE
MASVQSVFSQLFRAHCSHSDLGPINLNWFEELTTEAKRLQSGLREDVDEREEDRQDNSLAKTPQQKRSYYSQLESTPTIFREQSLCSPLFRSSTSDHAKRQGTAENVRNGNKSQQSPDITAPANDVFGASSRDLAESPVIMKQLFKVPIEDRKYLPGTPQLDKKFDISDSLLCTPQLIRNQTSRSVSESLGVQADPDMSWSSSLATPPSPTVIITQAKEEVSKPRAFNRNDVVIVQSLFSKMNAVPEAVSLSPPNDLYKINSDSTKFNILTSESREKSSDYVKAQQKKTVLNAVGDEDSCQVVEDAIEGMEDVLSIFFTNERPSELRKVKVDRRVRRKNKQFSGVTGNSDSLIENQQEQSALFSEGNLSINKKLLQPETCSREISSSYEWTPLNLPYTLQEERIADEGSVVGDCNRIETTECNDLQRHRNKNELKDSSKTMKKNRDGQYKEHKEKCEETLPYDASNDNKHLMGLVSSDHSLSLASHCDNPWKNEQKPKPILSTVKKQTKFLYSLKMDRQQTETTEVTDLLLYNEPLNDLETLDVQLRRSLASKNSASANNPSEVMPVINEDHDDFKGNRIDIQEIEETFINKLQTNPMGTSEVKSNLNKRFMPSRKGDETKLQRAESESACQVEDGVLHLSEAMVDHSRTIVNGLSFVTGGQEDGDHYSNENPFVTSSNCEAICTNPLPAKAESETVNKTCSDLLVSTNMQRFEGFKTASNNKIHISEENLRKGELVFKENYSLPILSPTEFVIEDKNALISMAKSDATLTHKGFQTASRKEIIVTDSDIAKGSMLFKDIQQEIFQIQSKRHKINTSSNIQSEQEEMTSNIEANSTKNLDEISEEEIKEENKKRINSNLCKKPASDCSVKGNESLTENPVWIVNATPTKMSRRNLHGLSYEVVSHLQDLFTESQKAEINELSSILENAGSQFDFTQVKTINLLGLDENLQNAKNFSDSQRLNTSDVWTDVDFNDSFSTGEGNAKSNAVIIPSESESKSDADSNPCDMADNTSRQDSFLKYRDGPVGELASGKSGNITDEDFIKAIELFSDLEEKQKEKSTGNKECNPQTFPITNNSPALQSVNMAPDSIQSTTVTSHAQTKENCFTGLNYEQENKCKVDKNSVPNLQPEAESVHSCDHASNGDQNFASFPQLPTMPVGFATGKGKLINVNKASLHKARTMFNDILVTDQSEDYRRTGAVHEPSDFLFETNVNQASTIFAGKETLVPMYDQPPMAFSKESKAPTIFSIGPSPKPKKILHLVKQVNKESCLKQNNATLMSSSFGTASGKRVHFSEGNLKLVHKTFLEVDDIQVAEQQTTGNVSTDSAVNPDNFLGLQKKSILVKESTLRFPQQGFSTANGKMINVSHKFVQKAQEIFADIEEPEPHSYVGQRNLSNVSKCKVFNICDVSDDLDHRMNPGVTQAGENIPLVHQITAQQSSEVSADITTIDNVSNRGMSNKTVHESENPNIYFSTAGKKFVQLSDNLKKAQGMFTGIDDSILSNQEKFGNIINQTERKNTKSSLPPLGFSTARGKTVAVSQSSLHKARQMFAEIDDNVAGLALKSQNTLTKNVDSQTLPSHAAEVKNLKPYLNQCSKDDFGKVFGKGLDTSICSLLQETSGRKMPFFSTASGNQVHLSSKALQKAREMLAVLGDGMVEHQSLSSDCVEEHQSLPSDGVEEHQSLPSDGVEECRSLPSDGVEERRSLPSDGVEERRSLPSDGVEERRSLPSDGVEERRSLPSDGVEERRSLPSDGVEERRSLPSDGVEERRSLSGDGVEERQSLPSDGVEERRLLPSDGVEEHQSFHGSVLTGAVITNKNFDILQSPLMQVNSSVVALPPIAFNTASGKAVTVSNDSLQKAKLIFVDTNNPLDVARSSQSTATIKRSQYKKCGGVSAVDLGQTNKRSSMTGKTSNIILSEGKARNDTTETVTEDGSVPKMQCFRTAGGKSVTVSEESLKRAQEIFSEVDNGCLSQHDTAVDIHLKPKSAAAERESLSDNNIVPEMAEIKYSPILATKSSVGFSSARGRQVCISKEALQKVKGFFEEFNTNETLDFPHENKEPRKMKTFNPLMNKHLKDFVTKPVHFQKNTSEGNGGSKNTPAMSSDISVDRHPLSRFVKHSTPLYGAETTNLYITSSHTPENDFEIEAAESAKAFMDDEDLTDGLPLCSDKLPNFRNGKRLRSEDGAQLGEPPIKRQLLPEFDRSLANESKSALRPLTSGPHENLKDRRKYFYKVSLQPLSTDPASFSKGKKETLKSKPIPVNQLRPKLIISKGSLAADSTPDASDCRIDPNSASRVITSFVTPFIKNFDVSVCDRMVNSPRQEWDTTKDISRSCVEVGTAQKDESGTDFFELVANICYARDMQEMRIRKKQRQNIKPQPGLLYRQKNASTNRISLVAAVERRQPTKYTSAELYRCGVIKNHIGINSEKARNFEFHCLDYFTRESFFSEGGVQIADGGWLIPADKLTAGREEFYRALCDTPGVDPKLISPEWVYNHYRWIVWKLAAMEVMFPRVFASRCLTPDRLLLQLKYRYDIEIDKCQRSAVRKIMERDDSPAKTLVLCISKILILESCKTSDVRLTSAIIEVTDGWYGIKAILDPALTSLLRNSRMFIGQKIIVQGAELVGSDNACSPLEAPESLMLKIAGNSTRPARWHAKLGYYRDPRPFCLCLSSLLTEGGVVGCVDVLLQRIYPMQWMEKMGNGTYVFRNERAEVKEAERHAAKQQKNLEVLFVKIQEEYEKKEVSAEKKRRRRQSLSEPQIRTLQDGAELYEALQNEPDPSYLESCLCSDQLRAVNHHRQLLTDKRHAQIQAEFRKAIESSEQEAVSGTRRDVTPVWKIRIVDYKDDGANSAYMLNIWRPLPNVVSLLKEGGRFKIYQLAVSPSKGRSDTAAVQLTATKKTQFQQLPPLQDVLEQIYTERQVTEFSLFLEPHFTAAYGEVDVVGLVICTQLKPGAAPLVYLSDETSNLVALKFYTDLGQLALEEPTRPSTFIAAANLRWRSEYMSGVPVLFAGDLSFIVANPKEQHLQRGIQRLRQSIQSVSEFCKEVENKLMNILQARNPQEKASLTRCSVDPRSHVGPGSRCSTPVPKLNNSQVKHMSTPERNNTVLNACNDMDPKTCKKMKGLDYLSRIPSPAPLTPMGTILSPSLQRAFRPPRSLHKDDRTCAKTGVNSGSCTPSKLGGFVADEELAMINTQALVSGLGGGSKLTTDQKISTSDIQEAPNIHCPTTEDVVKTQDISKAPCQRRLCRKRKQKP